ncbi:MAG: RNA-guided endonuclease IscB [Firmicutes bacterium]|nr:RNA-guided endonuclease IscB [Bacillota bacterium]
MVFVLDKHQKPLMPCSEKRARQLMECGRAVVHKIAPFTIRLKDRTVDESTFQPLRAKFDPGSKTTLGLSQTYGAQGPQVIFLGEIAHKSFIKARLDARRAVRRGRRNRKTRYRQARFQNRQRKDGWLPPSLEARVNQTLHALTKIRKRTPITQLSVEHVKFDTQKMQNPEIAGIEYQHGTLLGYEVREYLLEKWDRRCAYCDATDVPFEIEHMHPKGRGGSDRVSNLTIACHPCNDSKGQRSVEEFVTQDRGRRHRATQHARLSAGKDAMKRQERAKWEAQRLERLQRQRQAPLKDAALMNATRWRLYRQLQVTGLPVEGGSGGRTKMQRIQHDLPKEHYYDALCVGESTPNTLTVFPAYVQVWSAKGRGNRQRCRTDQYGFPIRYLSRQKNHFGFQTGDLVRAVISRGKYTGTWTGRATVKASGVIVIGTGTGINPEARYKHCRVLQRGDGWQLYTQRPVSKCLRRERAALLFTLKDRVPAPQY